MTAAPLPGLVSLTEPVDSHPHGARTVVFLRHGRTAFNVAGRLQGRSDIPLDEIGARQATLGVAGLLTHVTPDLIVSSPLQRARATAQVVADQVAAPVVVDDRVQERGFGQWEGKTGAELAAEYPEQWAAWQRGEEVGGLGIERRSEAGRRGADAIADYVARVRDGGVLLVVSHGALITVTISTLLGADPDVWRGVAGLDNVHWSRIDRAAPGIAPGWRLVTHNRGPEVARAQWMAGQW